MGKKSNIVSFKNYFGAKTIFESGLSITALIYAINSLGCVHTFTPDLLNAVVIIVLTA